MTITNRAIGQKIYEALRDSAAILDRSQELFGVPHAVYYGFSGQQSPSPENLPLFEIMAWGKDRSETQDNRSFSYTLAVSLRDETKTEELLVSGVYAAKYPAADYVEEFLDLAVAEIKAALPDLILEEESYEYDPTEFYPLYVGGVGLTLIFPNLGGGFESTL
ncbi:MAG: hypothetical protein A2Y80_02160 [Deltaproteobacteria bacterium RBG_13_58_19]|nr:MAG: hypothetical protein A2Y80_02160 [Deltaproteobacteria bacterium RBG_13_58_19]